MEEVLVVYKFSDNKTKVVFWRKDVKSCFPSTESEVGDSEVWTNDHMGKKGKSKDQFTQDKDGAIKGQTNVKGRSERLCEQSLFRKKNIGGVSVIGLTKVNEEILTRV